MCSSSTTVFGPEQKEEVGRQEGKKTRKEEKGRGDNERFFSGALPRRS